MNKKILFLLAGSLLFSGVINAQYHIIPPSDTAKVRKIDLNEVVVKSTRETSTMIKNLPAAISMMKAKTIDDNNVQSLKDLVGFVPNFFMPDYGSKLTSPVYIRGIGSRINSPSIGLYVDNVPYFEKSAFDFEFTDIDRIEVLRGPQGTSYGRNTMGGLINIYTKNPSTVRESKIELAGGNYGYFRGDVSHSQPLSSKTGVSASAFYGRHSGFFTNEFENTKVDEQDYYGARLKLVHNASEYLKFMLSSNYEHSSQGGYPYAQIDKTSGEVAPINYDFYSSYERDILSNALVVDYTPEKLMFQSATSYQFIQDDQNIDQDFTPASLFYVNQATKQHMVSQEFTVKNKPGRKITWVTGVLGFMQKMDDNVNVTYGADGIIAYKLPGPSSREKIYDNSIKGAALFHESKINNLFVKGLSLSAGIRFDYEKAVQDFLYYSVTSDVSKTMDDSRGTVDYTEILPKASLAYNMNDNISMYTTVAKGYKTGGFNTTFEREEDRSFLPEFSWNYEAGVKTIFFEKALLANFSAFYIDWENQQIYQPVPSGQGSMLKNAGRSVSKGFEAEIIVRPVSNLSFYTSYGYTDAKFEEYQRNATTNYKGNFIPYAPGNTLQVGADYSFMINNRNLEKITVFANYQGQGKIYWNEENTASQDYYGLVNGKISFVNKIGRLDLWAKNILNQEYNSFFFNSLGKSFVQVGKPVQLGASLVLTF